MKSLIRWSATIGLVGATLVGSFLAGTLEVLALTPEQILQKLRPVPLFTIANAEGAPLVMSPAAGQQGMPVATTFINQQDAQAFLNNVKTKNPELAKNIRVVPVSLAEIYQLKTENKDNKKEKLDFAVIPSRQQLDTAQSLLNQSGQKVQFRGIPLFYAVGGPEKGYLTIQQGNQAVIPMFFKKEDLQTFMERFKQQDPKMASSLQIQVANLDGVLEVMRTKNDPQLDQIMLVPPRESLEFIRSMTNNRQQPQANPQARPQAAPKK